MWEQKKRVIVLTKDDPFPALRAPIRLNFLVPDCQLGLSLSPFRPMIPFSYARPSSSFLKCKSTKLAIYAYGHVRDFVKASQKFGPEREVFSIEGKGLSLTAGLCFLVDSSQP